MYFVSLSSRLSASTLKQTGPLVGGVRNSVLEVLSLVVAVIWLGGWVAVPMSRDNAMFSGAFAEDPTISKSNAGGANERLLGSWDTNPPRDAFADGVATRSLGVSTSKAGPTVTTGAPGDAPPGGVAPSSIPSKPDSPPGPSNHFA